MMNGIQSAASATTFSFVIRPLFLEITPGYARYPEGLPKKNSLELLVQDFAGRLPLPSPNQSTGETQWYAILQIKGNRQKEEYTAKMNKKQKKHIEHTVTYMKKFNAF